MKRVAALVTTLFVAVALMAIPGTPWEHTTTPKADAQTNQNWTANNTQFGDCSLRQAATVPDVQSFAQQLCWLDMKELHGLGSTSKQVTKNLGRYTLTFDVRLSAGKQTLDSKEPGVTVSSQPNGDSVFGNKVFTQFAGDTTSPIVQTFGDDPGNKAYRFIFSNVRVTDKANGNSPVPNYRLVMADAQRTESVAFTERMVLHSLDRAHPASVYRRVTPPGNAAVCNPADAAKNFLGPGIEDFWSFGDGTGKDVICKEDRALLNQTTPGTFLAGMDNSTSFEIAQLSYQRQAFALAIDFGQMGGSVKADTANELQATGQETKFDFSMGLRAGSANTSVPWQGAGVRSQAIRQMSTAAGRQNQATDSQVFTSKATGRDANLALKRYKPTWTCSTPSITRTFTAGAEPAGFKVNNSATSSEVVATNADNAPMTCDVNWEPRFQATSLTLSKTVDGTASDFTELQTRRFTLAYECTAPDGFNEAYPGTKLSDARTLNKGESVKVDGLPVDSTCVIHEEFADGAPPARPGKDLDLTWSAGQASNADLPTTTVKLGANANVVNANNNYDFRAGTVTIDKSIIGEPVASFGNSRDYRFELKCATTPYTQTQTLQATGDPLRGRLTFTGVPVERDCSLRPLSGLSAAESQTINFDGRDVTVAGRPAEADANGAYPVRLPDYPEGGTATSAQVNITAKYSYKTRDVAVVKQVSGPAAALATRPTYPVTYRCTQGSSTMEGTLDITTDTANPAKIPSVRVGSECLIYEKDTPEQDNITLDRTTVKASNANDQVTELTNEEAKSKPVLTVSTSTDALQNRVVVTNHFVNKVGTVDLTKLVNANGISAALPEDFDLSFRCGTRAVELPDGSVRDVNLTGTTTLSHGESQPLRVNTGNAELDALVNDQNGAMGVPFGNTCTFAEKTPQLTTGGILWETDADDITEQITGPSTDVTVTNDFQAAGDGVTISHSVAGLTQAAQDVEYELSCVSDTGEALPLSDAESRFTLSQSNPNHTVPAASVPEGSECILRETSTDNGERSTEGKDYPVTRDTEVNVVEEDTTTYARYPFENLAPIEDVEFTVGASTVVNASHVYDYRYANLDATKTVAFDDATQALISDQRKEVKRNRQFDVQVVCTPPLGGSSQTFSGTVGAKTGVLEFAGVPIGSTCRATEGETSTAEGINVRQEVSAGNERADKSVEFVVRDESTPVELINTYSRRTASVELNKIAHTPIDIAAEYPDTPKEDIYYTHNFTMECRDPETGEGDAGALLGTFSNTITGPGQTTFTDVPVGADCHITGDKFGQLNLYKTDEDELETHLIPAKVDWLVDRNDGTTETDTDLADGETTSQYFNVFDDADEHPGTVVDLTNHYEFVKAKLKMSKQVVATEPGHEALNAANPEFDFQFQCRGVGYTYSTIGEGQNTLDSELTLGDFGEAADSGNNMQTRTYTSPEVEVPSGAWCTFVEQQATNTPPDMTHTVDPGIVEKRVGEKDAPAVSYDFVNRYERRMVPVDIAALQEGYLQGANPAGYRYNLTCNNPARTSYDLDFSLDQVNAVDHVADAVKPASGIQQVMLPAGSECTLNAANSPALSARAELEVTQGARSPFMEFGTWIGNDAAESNPDRLLSDVAVDDVTEQMKNYSYTFSIPRDITSGSGEAVMTVAGEARHVRDLLDLTFTKESVGAAGEGASYEFTERCTGTRFSLESGDSETIAGVPINQECGITETDDGIEDATPRLSVASSGERLANVQSHSEDQEDEAGNITPVRREWTFDVLPVTDASDTRPGGAEWALTGVNNYPGVDITKKIDGSPISVVTGTIADTALLNHEADSMHFSYEISNNGADELTDIVLREPGLAGRTITANGQEFTVPEGGEIPAEVCGLTTLPVGSSRTCEFDVAITEPKTENFTYAKEPGGVVTVTANAGGSKVTDSDQYGAFRVKESLAWLLPDSGSKLLVLVLLLGLLLLGYGLYRYLRNREDEEETS